MLYTHIQENYFVAHTQWLACKQRIVLALPSADGLHVVQSDIRFDGALVISEWRTSGQRHRAGEIVPIELTWGKLRMSNSSNFSFTWLLSPRRRRRLRESPTYWGSICQPELPAGAYQIRLGVYRPSQLARPNGDDSAHMP